MTTHKEALNLALEALESSNKLINGTGTKFGLEGAMDGYYSGCFDVEGNNKLLNKAITAIKEALAQPEQEPVAWPMEEQPDGSVIPIDPEEHPNFYTWTWDKFVSGGKWRAEYGWKKPEGFDFANLQPLYTTPPQRTWVGLTDEEILSWWSMDNGFEEADMCSIIDFRRFVEEVEAKLKEKNNVSR